MSAVVNQCYNHSDGERTGIASVPLATEDTPSGLKEDKLCYEVDDVPPVPVILMYGIQNVLANINGPITVSFILFGLLCTGSNDVFFAELMSTSIFMVGLCTILQCLLGVRLPIIQGSSFSYFPPIIAMMSTDKWKCPEQVEAGSFNTTVSSLIQDEPWRPRINEVSGALTIASLVQVVLGCSGAIGFLMNYIGPLTLCPTVSLIGLSLFPAINRAASIHWGIAFMACGLMLIFSLFLTNVTLPFPGWSHTKKGFHIVRIPVFLLFPHVLAIGITWLFCYILTLTDVFPTDPSKTAHYARTDFRSNVIHEAKWIFWPYPGQWGRPTVGSAMFVGMTAATLTSVMESIGDYYMTAKYCNVPPPPKHAMNRGIAMEGLGSVLSGLMGAGHATTSYSQNPGFINLTKMGSRITWIVSGIIFMVLGVVGKFGAILTCLPDPILGGLNIAALGMVLSMGLSILQHVDLNSRRNLLILAVSFMCGMTVPFWLVANPGAIQTGNSDVDQLLTVLLNTSMFVGGLIGFTLDNTVPGTDKERGIKRMMEHYTASDSAEDREQSYKVYDIPFISDWLKRQRCCFYVPFLPSYLHKEVPDRNTAMEVYRI